LSAVPSTVRTSSSTGRRRRRRLAILVAFVGTLLGIGLALAGGASAHATVVTSDPVDGSRLAHPPSVVTVTFDESVGLGGASYLHVTDQSGNRVDNGPAFHLNGDATKVADRLQPGLGDGTYIASYRVVSADSHPVAGTIRFVVGNGVLAATGVTHTSTVNPTTSVAFDIARWTSFTGFALLGGAWLLLTVWPQGRDDRRGRAIVWTGWGVAGLGALAELLLQGPYTAGAGLSGVVNWSLLDATLHSSFGHYLSGRLVVLGAVALVLGRALQRERWRSRIEDAAWPLAVAVALTFSSVGHPDTTNPRWLSVTADTLHVLAMAAWVGGMVVLAAAVLPRREPDEVRAVLPVFSRVAFTSVAVLAVTGSYAAWHGIGTGQAIFTTSYGLLVVGKVVLFLGLLALGNVSRLAVQRRLAPVPVAYAMSDTVLDEQSAAQTDDPGEDALSATDAERLRRSVLVEIVLAVCILVLTAVLVAQPRGKEAIATRELRPAVAATDLGDGSSARVTVSPGRHGTVVVDVSLNSVARGTKIRATAALPDKQLGPIPIVLAANGPNEYTASNVNLPAAGDWVISLVVTTSEFDAVTAQLKIHLY
jgi:copper transport protein